MPTAIYQPSAASLMDGGAVAGAIGIMTAAAADFHLKLPIAFGLADLTVLYTFPTGFKFEIQRAYWEITTSFTGGASARVGISSDDADYNTAGDILGGSGGEVTGNLLSSGRKYLGGTIGTKFGSNGVVIIGSGKVVRWNAITSAYTAGAGFLHLSGMVID